MKTSLKKIEVLKFGVDVSQSDIDQGACQEPRRCMEKVAIARTLMQQHPRLSDADLRVRVDAGHVRFNLHGFRWVGDTPVVARRALIRFDAKKKVEPHSFILTARRTSKIKPQSAERKTQINAARRARIKAGQPDKVYTRHTLRKRVVGYA